MEILNICLSDIPKESVMSDKNGKKYVNIAVLSLREKDNHGNDLTVCLQQSKEAREAKEAKTYIGRGKTLVFNNQTQQPQNTQGDGLPY